MAGDFVCDGRRNVRNYLRFLAALRGGVPEARIDDLADRLGLDQTANIKKLCKGNRQVRLASTMTAVPGARYGRHPQHAQP